MIELDDIYVHELVGQFEADIIPEPDNSTGSVYAKNVRLVQRVAELTLTGHNTQEMLDIMREEWPDLSSQKLCRMRRLAKKKINELAERDLDKNYSFVYNNYMRMFREAYDQGDLRLQGAILKDFMKLTGLEIQKVQTMIMTDDADEVMNKLDQLLQ